jgi:hypothetical protein
MKWYHHYSYFEFYNKYNVFLEQAISWGWDTKESYLASLYLKNPKSLTIIEKLILEEMKELDIIKEEIDILYTAMTTREPDDVLPFPMEENYKREFLANIEYIKKYRTVNLNDTAIIPYELPEESFMDRLMKLEGVDIKEEIRKCKKKFNMLYVIHLEIIFYIFIYLILTNSQ